MHINIQIRNDFFMFGTVFYCILHKHYTVHFVFVVIILMFLLNSAITRGE